MIPLMRRQALAVFALSGLLASGCGGSETPSAEPGASASSNVVVPEDPGPVHVHGLGINPKDDALFLATHTGLFRIASDEEEAVRVADRYQDTMGFTVLGPDRFLGSGHPDGQEDLPPFLGLIESSDAGQSWESISLQGEADFHALEAQAERVYGFGYDWESREPQFLVSSDGGESWDDEDFPEEFLSLAINPRDPDMIAASGETSTYLSTNAGGSWQELDSGGGLVAWPSPDEMLVVDSRGTLRSSRDGTNWQEIGRVPGEPASFESERGGLLIALHDGSILQSTDRGRSWEVRYAP